MTDPDTAGLKRVTIPPNPEQARNPLNDLGNFPPFEHFLRDLSPRIVPSNRGLDECRVTATPGLTGPEGQVRPSVHATLVDLAAGTAALDAADPDWILTADFDLHTIGTAADAREIVTRPRVLREGRKTVVLEVTSHARDAECRETELARTFMTFSVLPRRGEAMSHEQARSAMRERLYSGGTPFEKSIFEGVGLRTRDAAAGVVEVDVRPYVDNASNMLQGGVVAMLAEAAAERVTERRAGGPAVVTDLALRYLSPGRVGPVRTRAEVLRERGPARLVRIDVFDAGAEDRLVAAATASARPVRRDG